MSASRVAATPWLFTAAALIWGSTWLAIKFQLGEVAPEASVAYRFAIAAALLCAWCTATGRSLRFSARQHVFIALQGTLLFGVNYVGFYWAEQYAASGLVAVLFTTIVFMNPVGARIAFGTPLTLRVLAAALLGVSGVALLFLPEIRAAGRGGDAAWGIAYGIGSTAIAAAGNLVASRNQRAGIPVFPGIALGMAYGALAAALIATLHGVTWSFEWRPAYLASLLYLALFGSIGAFGAYLTLMRHVGPTRAAYVSVVTPVVALVLSTLLEGYRWTWVGMLGVLLAIAGNTLALRAPAARAATRAPAPT